MRPTVGPARLCSYETTGTTIPVHFHAMAELTLVRSGSGTMQIAGREHAMAPGLLSYAGPNVLHGISTEQPVGKSVCMFDMGLVEPLLSGDPVADRLNAVGSEIPAAVQLDASTAAAVGELFDTILAERHHPTRLGGGVMAATLIMQALVSFLRHADTAAPDIDVDEGAHHDELTRVLAHLQEHFTRPINRATVARTLGMRPAAVSEAFTGTGSTFTGFLQHLRVGHAVELLQSTDLTAADIGQLSGFGTYRTFARAFAAACHTSPQAYRDRHHLDTAERQVAS
ncbi:helix-turn-helix domain-containing protein [Propionibacteriaceae bacterium Y2011]